jgi:hypothetical protein
MHITRFRECYKIVPSEQNQELKRLKNSTNLLAKNKKIEMEK